MIVKKYETGGDPPESVASAVEKVMEDRKCSYGEALEAVRLEKPELFAAYMNRATEARAERVEHFTFAGHDGVRTYDAVGNDMRIFSPYAGLASGYRVEGLVGPDVMPVVPVPAIAGTAPLIGQGDYARLYPIARPPATAANAVQFSVASLMYYCSGFALSYPIPNEVEIGTDKGFRLGESVTRFETSLLLAAKEKEVFGFVGSATNVSTVFSVASAWGSGGDPIGTLEAAIRHVSNVSGARPDTVIFGRSAYQYFSANSSALYKLGGLATVDREGQVLRVSKVRVAEATYNAAPQGATPTYTPFFDDAIFVGVAGQGDFSPKWGATASWRPGGNEANRFYAEIIPRKSSHMNFLEIGGWEASMVMDKNLAVTIRGINSSQAGGI
jgi:hypothetical protein